MARRLRTLGDPGQAPLFDFLAYRQRRVLTTSQFRRSNSKAEIVTLALPRASYG